MKLFSFVLALTVPFSTYAYVVVCKAHYEQKQGGAPSYSVLLRAPLDEKGFFFKYSSQNTDEKILLFTSGGKMDANDPSVHIQLIAAVKENKYFGRSASVSGSLNYRDGLNVALPINSDDKSIVRMNCTLEH